MPFEVFFRVKRPTGEPCDGGRGEERRGRELWEGETTDEREAGRAVRGMGEKSGDEACVRGYGGKYEGRLKKGYGKEFQRWNGDVEDRGRCASKG